MQKKSGTSGDVDKMSEVFSTMMKLCFPWSGDVTQSINPWNMFAQMVGNNFSFINVQGKTLFPEVEKEILSEVGSYGRQLGIASEALSVLVKEIDLNKLDEKEKLAVLMFKKQIEDIRAIKRRRVIVVQETQS